MQFKEKVREQKRIVTFAYIAWLVAFVLPGLDHRFGWSHSPLWITILSQAIVFGGFATTLWVAKVNRFAERTIQVEPGQEVISSGPYRIIRHPMYTGHVRDVTFRALGAGGRPLPCLPSFPLIPLIVLVSSTKKKSCSKSCPAMPNIPAYPLPASPIHLVDRTSLE